MQCPEVERTVLRVCSKMCRFRCPRSGGRVRVNRVRTVKVAALNDVTRRFG